MAFQVLSPSRQGHLSVAELQLLNPSTRLHVSHRLATLSTQCWRWLRCTPTIWGKKLPGEAFSRIVTARVSASPFVDNAPLSSFTYELNGWSILLVSLPCNARNSNCDMLLDARTLLAWTNVMLVQPFCFLAHQFAYVMSWEKTLTSAVFFWSGIKPMHFQ